MATIITLVFRSDKKNKNGLGPIYLRFTKNRKVCYISTGKRIPEKDWDKATGKVKPSYPNSAYLNNYLRKLQMEYEEKLLKEESGQFDTSLRTIKGKITGKASTDFFQISESLLARYFANGKIGTHDKHRSIVNKLRTYWKGTSLPLNEITPKFLSDYELYLRRELGNKTNTVLKDLKFIRRVFNEAYRLDLIEHKAIPFNKYKMKSEKTHKVFLTDEEVLAFDKVPCLSKTKVARDMFIFSCYAGGMRVSDVLQLQCKCYEGDRIHFQIQKTGLQMAIKLPTRAQEIIQEHINGKCADDYIFAMLPNNLDREDPVAIDRAISCFTALVNKNLKNIAKAAGIKKNISFHIARHTWATLALKKGISLDKVSRLMGHASVRETQVYAKIVNEDLDRAMDAFN